MTATELARVASQMNTKLAAVNRDERWCLDTDTFSNSVGTWFCGNVGGVSDPETMIDATARLVCACGLNPAERINAVHSMKCSLAESVGLDVDSITTEL